MTFLRAKLRRTKSEIDLTTYKQNLMVQLPQNFAELIRAIKMLTVDEQKDFFEFVIDKKQLKFLISNERELIDVCKAAPKAASNLFKILGQDFLQAIIWKPGDYDAIEWVNHRFYDFPPEARLTLLRDYLGPDFLKDRILHPDYLNQLISSLKADEVDEFLYKALALDFLKKIIKDGFAFYRGIPCEYHANIIKRLGLAHIGKLCTNSYDLHQVLPHINKDARTDFLYHCVGINHIRGFIKTQEQLDDLLNCLPEKDQSKINDDLQQFVICNFQISDKRIEKNEKTYYAKNGTKVAYAKPLHDDFVIGLSGMGWGYKEIVIYNTKTEEVIKREEIKNNIRDFFILDKNRFIVQPIDVNYFSIMSWDETTNKIKHEKDIVIPLDYSKREAIGFAGLLPDKELVVITHDNDNIVNNYKTWCVRFATTEEPIFVTKPVVKVRRDEHFWPRHMIMGPSGILVGWSVSYDKEDAQKLCLIDPRFDIVQTVHLAVSDTDVKITNVALDERNKILVELNNGLQTLEFDVMRKNDLSLERALACWKTQDKSPNFSTKLNSNSPTLFANTNEHPKKIKQLSEKQISDEEMTNSAFGQASNTARSLKM